MDLICNTVDLAQPPLITVPVKNVKFDVPALRKTVETAITFFESQKEFEECAALCSRLVARRTNSFRNMDGFKSLCKLNASLCRILRIDIKEVLRNFLGVLPEFSMGSRFETQVPSLANLEYVLIRLMSLNKIFIRIEKCCKQTAWYFSRVLSKNFFLDTITLYLAAVSTIWKISLKIRCETNLLYKKLVEYRKVFPKTKKHWLKEELIFPEELENAVNVEEDNVTVNENTSITSKPLIKLEAIKQTTPTIRLGVARDPPNVIQSKIDLGTVISRDSLAVAFDVNKISNVNEIRKFLLEEEKKRRENLGKCLTKSIANDQWILVKKRIKNKINSNDNKGTIKTFKDIFNNL